MFLPENIDLTQSEKYNLSIRLAPDGFSFCIYSSADTSVFHYREMAFSKNLSMLENIKKTFFEVNFFMHPFKRTSVTVVSPKYTLVPDAFFDRKSMQELYQYNIHGQSNRVLSNFLPETSCHLLFGMDEEVYSFLLRNLWNPSFNSHAANLMPFFAQYKAEDNRKRCFVDFHDNMISLFCFDGEKLLSANSYPNSDKHEALYYTASVWENLPFDQNADWLFLSGNIADNKESISILKQLIKQVEVIEFAHHGAISETELIPTDTRLLAHNKQK